MLRRWSFRVYPTPEQEVILVKTFGCCRYVYNWGLSERTKAFATGKKLDYVNTAAALTLLKKEPDTAWLNDVSSVTLQQSLRHLQVAFSRFFDKTAKYPKLHKKGRRDAATYMQTAFTFNVGEQRLFLAKMKSPLKVNFSRRVDQVPTSVTIIRKASGKYFASFVVDVSVPLLPKTGQSVGIDFGISRLATLSTGERVSNPRLSNRFSHRLRLRQKSVSRKYEARKRFRAAVKKEGGDPKNVRPSKREIRARRSVALVHEKIANCRKDKLDKFTTDTVRRFDSIYIEDLNLRGMVKNHNIARSLADVGIGTAVRMLESKAAAANKVVLKVDRWFPSSKTCSKCGYLLDRLRLAVREWTCPACLARHDRDENAALNILAAGQAVAAHGDEVKPVRVSTRKGTLQRSANPQASST